MSNKCTIQTALALLGEAIIDGYCDYDADICFNASSYIDELIEENKSLKAERDKAIECLKSHKIERPSTCKHYKKCYEKAYKDFKIMPCIGCDKWEWRGLEELK